jgi:hypothetical protein
MPFLIVMTMVLVAAVLGALSYYMKKRKHSDPDLVICESKGVVPEPQDSQTAREVISIHDSHRSANKTVVDFHPEISRQSDKLRSKKAYAALSMPFDMKSITLSPQSFFKRKNNDLL